MSAEAVIKVIGNHLSFHGKEYRCAIGKGGFSADKREGDGCTPLGGFALRECWWRPDRVQAPKTGLPLKEIHEKDGWCDDPKSTNYNLHIKRPFAYSHEALWRDDHRYDLIVPLGYNDDPAIPGRGSAIFMHIAAPDYTPTEGCVALSCPDLLEILALCDTGTSIEIQGK